MKPRLMRQLLESYQVERSGTVRSLRTGEAMHQHIHRGYWCVYVSLNGKRTRLRVHRLVALVHIPNPKRMPLVEHKDDDKLNPKADNLEWVSYSENARRAVKADRWHRPKVFQVAPHPLVALPTNGQVGYWFPSMRALNDTPGFCRRSVHRVFNGEAKTHAGYQWSKMI